MCVLGRRRVEESLLGMGESVGVSQHYERGRLTHLCYFGGWLFICSLRGLSSAFDLQRHQLAQCSSRSSVICSAVWLVVWCLFTVISVVLIRGLDVLVANVFSRQRFLRRHQLVQRRSRSYVLLYVALIGLFVSCLFVHQP